ncbi:hypothetical protein CLOLEP_02080 [[Clostridium] leptum DSM 753]|uniref:Uncharacterized protein n=1 Tax=[Clostridium] leptum DSM 753 TaxID=428125 RepID=A7VU34_9FIRM|nr:hypothetical protein CLOLEP_02080 [[Clostridium] leptum DSM 753]
MNFYQQACGTNPGSGQLWRADGEKAFRTAACLIKASITAGPKRLLILPV